MLSKLDFWTAGAAMACDGKRIAREGWNGKNMFVVRRDGYPNGVKIDATTAAALRLKAGETVVFGAYAVMKTADGSVVPWLVSQTDMFARDWVILDG